MLFIILYLACIGCAVWVKQWAGPDAEDYTYPEYNEGA